MDDSSFIELDIESFDIFIKKNDGIVIFYKKLCPHCKVMKTVLGKVKIQIPDIKIAEVDSEKFPDLMERAGVSRIPTLCAIRNGNILRMQIGIKNTKETIAFYNN